MSFGTSFSTSFSSICCNKFGINASVDEGIHIGKDLSETVPLPIIIEM